MKGDLQKKVFGKIQHSILKKGPKPNQKDISLAY